MNLLSLLEARVISPAQSSGVCVILLGASGSGKSTVLKHGVINLRNYRYLNSDIWVHGLAKRDGLDLADPETTADLHHRVTDTHNRFRRHMLKVPDKNLVVETTGRLETVNELISVLRANGWYIVTILVRVSLATTLEGNRSRDRRVPEEVVRISHKRVERTFYKVAPDVDEAWVVDNDARPSVRDFRTSNFIERVR